jgi:cytoplasmic FMR1 interacting protein
MKLSHLSSELKQRYVFDEIEAEVNLAFDSLVYLLSNSIFAFFKRTASSMIIDQSYKSQVESIKNVNLSTHPSKYPSILNSRTAVILGRKIDIQALIAQNINKYSTTWNLLTMRLATFVKTLRLQS